ncbi:thiamine-phosphate pyrophosphorylase [Ekhidna lutea]|uniref:Thiamine-phosphate pyrophosphorylase n=1 Tax=Ekhidna lutea TaxID=447679 RepID=A0A239FL44_EKHLU|nr:thiamine phosphate synthase [Ekhidna lutea]SNS56973.1 thiamine-phosphate pyrophosphorylase [Ekhidna lutea]
MKKLSGIYLVLDPSLPWDLLCKKVHSALKGGVSILQIWNHWNQEVSQAEKIDFINEIKAVAELFHTPVLMHEDWQLANKLELDGVHFDVVPERFDLVKATLKDKYIGLTVGNNLELVSWAEEQDLSYISFCAMFPSSSVDSCEIVDQQTVVNARRITRLPIFLSGGIQPENLKELSQLPFVGIAIISGIINADDPENTVRQYLTILENMKN